MSELTFDAPAKVRPARVSLGDLLSAQALHSIKELVRSPVAAIVCLLLPIIFLLVKSLTAVAYHEGAREVIHHLACTAAVFATVMASFVMLAYSVAIARERGVLKRLRGTPVPPSAYIAGRIASVFWVATITVGIVFAAGALIHDVSIPLWSLPAVVAVVFIGTTTFATLGFAVAALARDSGSVSAITLATLLPLKFVSDVFPVGGALPPFVNAVGWVFPIKHMVHAMRTALDAGQLALGHLSVVTLWALVAVVVAMLRFRFEP